MPLVSAKTVGSSSGTGSDWRRDGSQCQELGNAEGQGHSVWAAFNSHYLAEAGGRVCVTRDFLVLTWGVPSMVCV